MFAFCVGELGFSEGATYNRILVARAGREMPAVIEAMRSGQVHLAGLRLLAPHLTPENHRELLAEAAGKSKHDIEELVARVAPKQPVPALVRRIPDRVMIPPAPLPFPSPGPAGLSSRREEHLQEGAPLAEGACKGQVNASQVVHDKRRHAQDLLR